MDDAGYSRPPASHSACHAVFRSKRKVDFEPVQNTGGDLTTGGLAEGLRAGQHLASDVCCPLLKLHRDADLRAAHLNNLSGPKPQNRGEVDPHLAITRAKINDAETFDEVAPHPAREIRLP